LDGILTLAATPADADPGAGADKLVFEAAPQPMREDYVENAVKFLSHPKVRGSSTTGGDVPLVCLRGEYLTLLGSYSHNLRAHRFEPRSAASQLEALAIACKHYHKILHVPKR